MSYKLEQLVSQVEKKKKIIKYMIKSPNKEKGCKGILHHPAAVEINSNFSSSCKNFLKYFRCLENL